MSAGAAAAVLAAGAFSFASAHPCEHESAYYCAFVTVDEERPAGRALWLDTLRHSYVDLDDPSHLEFTYTQWFGDVVTATAPDGEPLDALHIGGGGFTMPRFLRSEHPGSTSTVLEVDPLLVEVAQEELGLELRGDIEVLTGDARLTIERVGEEAYDVAIGDAFGGVAIPWHLATRQFITMVHDTLRPGGLYTLNVIDYGPRDFLRAQIATVADVFEHVATIGRSGSFGATAGDVGGNFVVLASDAPLPLEQVVAIIEGRGHDDDLLSGQQLDAFVGDAQVLVDDYAPVDQLLTPLPRR
jgi:spermidine synthase